MSLKKNIISNFILTASTILFPLVTLPYITRTLSAHNIGRVFYIDSFTQYLMLFAALGITFYGVREVAKVKENKQQLSQLTMELVVIQFTLSVLACLCFLCLPLLFENLRFNSTLVKIGCISIASNAFMIEWFYQGMENFTFITIRSLILRSISVLFILFTVTSADDYAVYYLISALGIALSAAFNFGFFLKNHYASFKWSKSIFRHLRPLLVLFSINVSISLYTVMDTIILGSITTPDQVSFYNIPLKIVKLFWTVMGGIGLVLIPKMSSLFSKNDSAAIQSLMKNSISIVLILGIPFFFFVLVFPTEVLLIVSGTQYLPAKPSLQILAIVPLIIGLCNVFGTQYLMAIGMERKILFATIFGFIVSLSLNFGLIPFFGYIGSAIACLCSELTVCLVVFYHAKKTIKIHVDYPVLFLILSSILAAVVSWLLLRTLLHQYYLMFATSFCYLLAFLLLHFLVFRSHFVNQIINFRSKS